MMNGELQRILGHARIEQTMAYAHFAPDFLQDAISYNPLRGKANVERPHRVHTWMAFRCLQWSMVKHDSLFYIKNMI